MYDIRLRAMEILDKGDDDDKPSLWCDRLITFVILLSVAEIILESVDSLGSVYGAQFQLFERFSVGFFTVEFLLRLWSNGSRHPNSDWRGRKEYIFSFHGFVDLISILPFYLQVLFPGADLRILRILRLTRLLKLSHYSTAIEDLASAIYAERRSFGAVLYLLSIAVVASSSLMYYAEAAVQPDKLQSIPHAIYWSVITLTTVGYGDVSPITPIGKAIAIVTAFLGIATLAIFSGIVATSFANQLARKKVLYEQQLREALSDGHIELEEDQLLQRLQTEFGLSDEMVSEIASRVTKGKP
ncbi:MAG: potassium channel family protein [Paracoccaceae bacterium]